LDELARQSEVLATEGCRECMWRVDGGKDSIPYPGRSAGNIGRSVDNPGRKAWLNRQKSAEAIVTGEDVPPVKGRTPSEGLTWCVREICEDSRKPHMGPTSGRKR